MFSRNIKNVVRALTGYRNSRNIQRLREHVAINRQRKDLAEGIHIHVACGKERLIRVGAVPRQVIVLREHAVGDYQRSIRTTCIVRIADGSGNCIAACQRRRRRRWTVGCGARARICDGNRKANWRCRGGRRQWQAGVNLRQTTQCHYRRGLVYNQCSTGRSPRIVWIADRCGNGVTADHRWRSR